MIINSVSAAGPTAYVRHAAFRAAPGRPAPLIARSGHRSGLGSSRSRRDPGLGPDGLARDEGTVTAETAVVVPSLLVLLMIFVWIILVVTAQLRVVDAARAGARAAARGENVAESAAVAERAAPVGAEAFVSRSGDDVRVEVRVVVDPPGRIPLLPSIPVEAVAYAAAEDDVGADRIAEPDGVRSDDTSGQTTVADDP